MINKSKICITAHAGCMDTRMDSIESIEAAIKYAADIIEIDLNICENGNLILSHNIPEEFEEYPKLNRVLDLIKIQKDMLLNIDVKNIEVLKQLKNSILEYELSDRVFLTGLHLKDIINNTESLEGVNYFINIELPDVQNTELMNFIEELKKLNTLGININYKFVTKELVAACKEKDLMISVWTVDDTFQMDRMINFKVNSITTKRIDILKNKLSEMESIVR